MGGIKRLSDRYFMMMSLGMVIGILAGTVLLSILISYRIDQYQNKIASLETEIEDKDVRLQRLEESINKTKVVVKDIAVSLDFGEEEDIDRSALEKHIKEKYNSLLGKEVKSIDIEILAEVVDRRYMVIDESRYQIFVTKVMLTEILMIWAEVVPIED